MICLVFESGLLFSELTIMLLSPQELMLVIGILLISLLFCCFVGVMSFPFAVMGNLIDNAERQKGKSLSGSYSGSFVMIGSLGSALATLITVICLQIFGVENKISYGIVFAICAVFAIGAVIPFKKCS